MSLGDSELEMIEADEPDAPENRPRLNAKSDVEVREEPNGLPVSYSLSRHHFKDEGRGYIIVGFDTEYQTTKETFTVKDVKAGLARYEVLSYQFFAIEPTGREWSGIAIPDNGKRMSLTQFVVFVLAKGASEGYCLPKKIVLVGHFNKADFPAFEDRSQVFWHTKNIRNSLITVGAAIPVQVAFADGQDPLDVKIDVRDTMQFAPKGSKSLAKLGDLIGVSKLTLAENPEEELLLKRTMKNVRAYDWELFRPYAIRDAEVCAKYFARVVRQVQTVTGNSKIPIALSTVGMNLLLQDWAERKIDRDAVLGREQVQEITYSKKLGRFITTISRPYVETIAHFEQLATYCYHGGRNEQMWFGPSFKDNWVDYDLASAYPTAMAMIGMPNWDAAYTTNNLIDFCVPNLGFAYVEFEFPESVRYPTLPVRSRNGIIFPLMGRTFCCSPEIQLAQTLGCKTRIIHGLVIPIDPAEMPFLPFIKASIDKRLRARAAKSKIEEEFWKEATNSCYGKTAQGLREKRAFDLRDQKSKPTKQSQITNAFYAATITSIVRAVMGEMMNAIPEDRIVFCVTTDGFITNATDQEILSAQAGDLCRQFSQTRILLSGKPDVCEPKHWMKQVLGWRTRGQATILKDGNKEFVLARAGIKPPFEREQNFEYNDYILQTFFDRTASSTIEFTIPTSWREMVLYDVDMVMKLSPRRTSMEYDLKRKPYAVAELDVAIPSLAGGIGNIKRHVSFSTVPWKNFAEFNAARKSHDDLWKKSPRCMKTAEDFRAFAEHYDSLQALGTKNAKWMREKNGDLHRLKRDLCRAFKKGKAGLDRHRTLTAGQFSKILNQVGFEDLGIGVNRWDVENNAKSEFTPNTSPPTAAVLTILERLETLLPGIDQGELLSRPAQDGVQLTPALTRSLQREVCGGQMVSQ